MVATQPVPPEWADRIAGLAEIDQQMTVLGERKKAIGSAFVAALDSYERMITEHRLDIKVPCGFRADPPMWGSGGRTFWRFVRIEQDGALFVHDCEEDHYTVQSDSDEWLCVPILFFTHPEEWLVLTALAADPTNDEETDR